MASTQTFVDYVIEQAHLPGRLTHRKMFGEYALYVDGKVVAFVCDNQVFLKPTAAAEALITQPVTGQPYPGAKPHLQVSDLVEDRDTFQRLLAVTANSLPAPKPKPKAGVKASAKTGR